MSKPNDYRETHIITEDVSYQNANKAGGGTQASQGILRQGRVVWSQGQELHADPINNVTVYAEGIGIIDLPAEALSKDRLTSLRR